MRDGTGRFLPGNKAAAGSTNSGRPPIPEDLKAVKRLNAVIVELMITKFLELGVDDFRSFVEGKKGTMLEMMIASIIHKGVVKGEPAYLSFLFDRTIGKLGEEKLDGDDVGAVKEKLEPETVVAYLKSRRSAA